MQASQRETRARVALRPIGVTTARCSGTRTIVRAGWRSSRPASTVVARLGKPGAVAPRRHGSSCSSAARGRRRLCLAGTFAAPAPRSSRDQRPCARLVFSACAMSARRGAAGRRRSPGPTSRPRSWESWADRDATRRRSHPRAPCSSTSSSRVNSVASPSIASRISRSYASGRPPRTHRRRGSPCAGHGSACCARHLRSDRREIPSSGWTWMRSTSGASLPAMSSNGGCGARWNWIAIVVSRRARRFPARR